MFLIKNTIDFLPIKRRRISPKNPIKLWSNAVETIGVDCTLSGAKILTPSSGEWEILTPSRGE